MSMCCPSSAINWSNGSPSKGTPGLSRGATYLTATQGLVGCAHSPASASKAFITRFIKTRSSMRTQSRRNFLKKTGLSMIMLPAFEEIAGAISPQVYFTTGFRISEVTCRSAIFWTRLCRQETTVPIRHQRREEVFRHHIDFDENQPVEQMDGRSEDHTTD